MIFFPHIIARVGGTSFSQLKTLSINEISFVVLLEQVLENEISLQLKFNDILLCFSATFKKTDNYRLRAILKNWKKDFENKRLSFLKKLEKNDKRELLRELLIKISIYSDSISEHEKLKNEFDAVFKKVELYQYNFLINFFQNEYIQKGILQSSHSLFYQNNKLPLRQAQDYKKKERQTLRALAQYFYRIGGKTSPLSHFTTVDVLSKNEGVFQSNNLESGRIFFQYNNFILTEMKILLLKEPTFFGQLHLKLNPSTLHLSGELHFIKNSNNIETYQQVETSEILLYLNQLIITNQDLTFDSVVSLLIESVESDKESIEGYLLELIEIGLLEWQWDFSGLTFNWEYKLLDFLTRVDFFNNKDAWIICLDMMVQGKIQLEFEDAKYRFLFQKKLKTDLEKLGLKKINIELLFFEDVRKVTQVKLSENEIEPIVQSLDFLLNLIEPLTEDKIKDKIKYCYSQNFKGRISVPLLIFYQTYYQLNFNNITPENEGRDEKVEWLKSEIKKTGRVNQFGDLVFNLKDLENILLEKPSNPMKCYSGLFQFYKKEEKVKAVINGLAPGYGKLFGRFLPLFDDEITTQLQEWNIGNQEEDLWVENIDASVFNANLHPPLLINEIKNSNSQNNLPSGSQILIKDIEVMIDEDTKEVILVYSKTKKRIYIFDFGSEYPGHRSPMFQLLNGFNKPHYTYQFFIKIVNEMFNDIQPNDVKNFRRVVIDDHLILQRKSKEVPHSFFPEKEKNESNSSYFVKVQRWKSIHLFPQYVFIKPSQFSEGTSVVLNDDIYKPQLIDLNSPIAIVLLQKFLKKYLGRVKIEEILPSEEEFFGDSVSEFVVQWKNIRD